MQYATTNTLGAPLAKSKKVCVVMFKYLHRMTKDRTRDCWFRSLVSAVFGIFLCYASVFAFGSNLLFAQNSNCLTSTTVPKPFCSYFETFIFVPNTLLWEKVLRLFRNLWILFQKALEHSNSIWLPCLNLKCLSKCFSLMN